MKMKIAEALEIIEAGPAEYSEAKYREAVELAERHAEMSYAELEAEYEAEAEEEE